VAPWWTDANFRAVQSLRSFTPHASQRNASAVNEYSESEKSQSVEENNFHLSHLHLASPFRVITLGISPRSLEPDYRVHRLSCGVGCAIGLAVLIEFQLMSDDGPSRTHRHKSIAYTAL